MKKKVCVSRRDLFEINSQAVDVMKNLSKPFVENSFSNEQSSYSYLQVIVSYLNRKGLEIELNQEVLDHPDRFLKRG